MQQLIATIENLLIEHDCVVVPGLGGFIQNEQEACYDARQQLFYPAGKQLSFNAKLYYNDGLICQAYQMEQGLSFESANLQIRQAVADMKEQLRLHHHLSLGKLGYLHQENAQAPMVFYPALHNDLCINSFGLKPCAFPKPKQEEQALRPVMSQVASYVAAIAACFLLLFTFVQDNDNWQQNGRVQQVQEAAILPSGALHSGENKLAASVPTEAESSTEVSLETKSLTAAESSVEAETSTETKAVEKSATQTETSAIAKTRGDQNLSTESLLNHAKSQKQYLIVIASFPDAEQALQYIKNKHLQAEYSDVGVAVSAERCRVYAASYESKTQALEQLEQFRQDHPNHAKAWVLVH